MEKCEVCENEYDKIFEVIKNGQKHIFDSIECAIHLIAPVCVHCSCKILGHGIEAGIQMFCCASCARKSGVSEAKDRVKA